MEAGICAPDRGVPEHTHGLAGLVLGAVLMRALLLLMALFLSGLAQAEGLLVVANPQVPVNSISTEDLAAIYLIQKTAWGNGLPVVPVNREAESEARELFSQEV